MISLVLFSAIKIKHFAHTAREGKLNFIARLLTMVRITINYLSSHLCLCYRLSVIIIVVVIVSELEKLFGRLWTQCQECQGSLHQDVLCTRSFFSFKFIRLVLFYFQQHKFYIYSVTASKVISWNVVFWFVVGIAQYSTGGRKLRKTWLKPKSN